MRALTEKQRDWFLARAEGEPYKSIAARYGVGISTVQVQVERAISKMGARTLRGAVVKWNQDRAHRIEELTSS